MQTELDKILFEHRWQAIADFHLAKDGEIPEKTKHQDEAKAKIQALLESECIKARVDPFDFVEPCEPDCTPERHAYHQGQWDLAGRINRSQGFLPHPGARDE